MGRSHCPKYLPTKLLEVGSKSDCELLTEQRKEVATIALMYAGENYIFFLF